MPSAEGLHSSAFRYVPLWIPVSYKLLCPTQSGICLCMYRVVWKQVVSMRVFTRWHTATETKQVCNRLRRSLPTLAFRRQNVLHLFLYTVSCHRSRPLLIVSLGWSIFYSCKKGSVVALLALYSNILVMHLGTGPTAGHSAMVVVKKSQLWSKELCFS